MLAPMPVLVSEGINAARPTRAEFEELASILSETVQLLADKQGTEADLGVAVRTLRTVCTSAITAEFESVALSGGSDLALFLPDSAMEVAELGIELCTRLHYCHALNLCNHLAACHAEDKRPEHALVCLLACMAFYSSGVQGSASQKAASLFRARFPEARWKSVLDSSEERMFNLCRFDVVDMIRHFRTVQLDLPTN